VLAARGLRVVAVDNGPIAPEVMATQLVEHRREDAFRFRPERPVDWMVCDVVAAPARIAALAAQWIARRWCRETIFNLKLPGKARWHEVRALSWRHREGAGRGRRRPCAALQAPLPRSRGDHRPPAPAVGNRGQKSGSDHGF